jgi:hypothetical protein
MLIPVTLNQRADEAEIIIEGKVTGSKSVWASGRTNIYTISQLEIYKVFKGNIDKASINIITLGGQIGEILEVTEPELKPDPGLTGIFFLRRFNGAYEGKSEIDYEPVAASQGLIEYDIKNNTASGVFESYQSVSNELYPLIYKQTKFRKEIKYFNPEELKKEANSPKPLAAPIISTISPNPVTAGTFSVLTITGSNFGASYVAGTSALQFRNANDGGSTYITALDNLIISWTDTEIQAYVPTQAGTGTIQVTNSTNETTTSTSTLTITYNQSNPLSGGVYYEPNLIQDNGTPGYRFSYSTATDNNGVSFDGHTNAKARFESALNTWRCYTGFNVDVSTTTNTTTAAVNDGINAVLFDNNATPLPNGVLGRATSRYSGCNPGSGLKWYVHEIDIVFRRDGTGSPAITWYFGADPGSIPFSNYDFESVALHETGHGHQLGHIISSGAVMHYSIANSVIARTPSATRDVPGGTYVLSHSNSFNFCGTSGIITHSCFLPVTLTEFSGTVKNRRVYLKWKTEDEVHLDHYILERSVDGLTFSEAQTITAQGKEQNIYYAEDDIEQLTYYRLRMRDEDGSFQYSKIISFFPDIFPLKLYPNPSASASKEVFIKSHFSLNDITSILIMDIYGRINELKAEEKDNKILLNKPQFPGIYKIILNTSEKTFSLTLIVE